MSTGFTPQLTIQTTFEPFSDARTHGYQGPSRNVRLPRACSSGAGVLSKSEDGMRCAVTGKESLKILRITDPSYVHDSPDSTYKTNRSGKGGHRVDASRNYWEGSGLKIDSASTDIAWCREQYSTKILTSARNGELIMWDINKSGSKYERRSKDHLRSIHKLSVSPVVSTYCITGSSDGDLRVWDLRDFQKSIMRIHHTTGVRGVVFSPVVWSPLQAVVGLENGNILRWDLKMGQRGQLDRIAVAHTASVMSLDWCSTSSTTSSSNVIATESTGNGYGWIVSGGLDRCVKVWDLTSLTANPSSHIPHKPAYTLHPSFPVRRVLFRPSYDCEVAIISNAEFGSGSNPDMGTPASSVSGIPNSPSATARALPGALQTPLVSQGTPGVLSRIGSGIGLDLLGVGDSRGEGGRSYGHQGSRTGRSLTPTSGSKASSVTGNTGIGDAAEIWDVRRGWIAKWNITGSAVDGGVTDITFGDSHTIWAQHWSGMFSQIDLRDATKPIDAIPRVATTWGSSGSLTFVADAKSNWEIPYDDVRPEVRKSASERGLKQKALGDPIFRNTSQNMGTFYSQEAVDDLNVFAKLARRYIVDGDNRKQICTANAQAAFQAGHLQAAQVWLLVAMSLTDVMPETPSKQSCSSSAQPKEWAVTSSVSAPAALVSHKTQSPGRGSIHGSDKVLSNHNTQRSQRSLSTTSMQRRTPGSSANSSPHQGLIPLPPLTPSVTRYPSYLGRRTSVDAGVVGTPHPLSGSRRPSILRRPSTSTHSASPSNLSLKHVGEGALDDSDSSSSSDSGMNGQQEEVSDDDEGSNGSQPLISPALTSSRIAHPSPLSRMVDHERWTEDEDGKDEGEDETSSPSPKSTDSESDSGTNADVTGTTRRTKVAARRLSRRNSTATKRSSKSRSRSGTLEVSLATVSSKSLPSGRTLAHRESSSSIRTVTAGGDTPYGDANGIKAEETIRDIRNLPHRHSRDKSLAVSDLVQGNAARENDPVSEDAVLVAWTHRDAEVVESEEKKLRQVAWDALREAFEKLADLGDVQMCAMLVIIVAQELAIGPKRALAFIDSYIERLTRLKLFTSASYIRKHSRIEEIRTITLTETTIHTACGRCKKALVAPQKAASRSHVYCSRCKSNTITCSICRLPVRGLLFQCSVCAHGGHQQCYRRYYKQRPMVNLPGSAISTLLSNNEARGRSLSRSNASNAEDDETSTTSTPSTVDGLCEDEHTQLGQSPRLVAHPCAAGCGHHCWISYAQPENT